MRIKGKIFSDSQVLRLSLVKSSSTESDGGQARMLHHIIHGFILTNIRLKIN